MERYKIFKDGFIYGQAFRETVSAGTVSIAFPEFSDAEIDIFISGVDDGILNDTYRLNLLKRAHTGAS